MTSDIPAETVARLVELARELVGGKHGNGPMRGWQAIIADTSDILATLPQPVPEDLLAAREYLRTSPVWHPSTAVAIDHGEYVDGSTIAAFRAGWAARGERDSDS